MTTNTETMRAALEEAQDFINDVHHGEWAGKRDRRALLLHKISVGLAQAEQQQEVQPICETGAPGRRIFKWFRTVPQGTLLYASAPTSKPEEPKQPDWLAEKPNDQVYKSVDDLFDALGLEQPDLPAILQREAPL